MESPEDNPSIKLHYRAPADEPTGPTTIRVFAGICCSALGLAALSAGLLCVGLAASTMLDLKLFGPGDSKPLPRGAGFAPALAAAMLFFATQVMFKMAHRLFQRRARRL